MTVFTSIYLTAVLSGRKQAKLFIQQFVSQVGGKYDKSLKHNILNVPVFHYRGIVPFFGSGDQKLCVRQFWYNSSA